jgi:hypothetical protein
LRKLIRRLKDAAKRIFDPWLSSLIDWLRDYVNADHDMLYRLYASAGHGSTVPDDRKDNDKLFARVRSRANGGDGHAAIAVPYGDRDYGGGQDRTRRYDRSREPCDAKTT